MGVRGTVSKVNVVVPSTFRGSIGSWRVRGKWIYPLLL